MYTGPGCKVCNWRARHYTPVTYVSVSTSVSSDKLKVSEKRVMSDVRLPTSWGAACAVKLKARALAPGRWRLCARARRPGGATRSRAAGVSLGLVLR